MSDLSTIEGILECLIVPEGASMKLYAVYNGWVGEGPIHVLVVAHDEELAKDIACYELQRIAAKWKHPSSYWNELEVELLFNDLTKYQVSSINGTY